MAASTVVSRENIANWAPDSPKLYLFRKAMEAMQEVSDIAPMDERGYQWVAGVHGGFGGQPYCHHGDFHFVTWHRPYVLDMELKLRAQIATFADQATADEWRLPYWAWDLPDVQGLPLAFTEPTYVENGVVKPNPLLSAPYRLPYPITDLDPGTPSDATWRKPGSLDELRRFGAMVQRAVDEPLFNYFSSAIQQPHNDLHNWMGGFMPTLRSSFDPIFWVHHANVDRHFWLWQQGAGKAASIPQSVRQNPCQPFNFQDIRAEAFFDTRTLGYTYADARSLVLASDAVAAASTTEAPAPLPLDFGTVPAQFQQARLNFHNVQHPERTIELRVFANRDGGPPDSRTPPTAQEHFLTSYVLLGHGACPGAPGHCDPGPVAGQNLRPPHHLAPYDIFIDVTDNLRQLAGAIGPNGQLRVQAQLIVLDTNKVQLPVSALVFDNASLTVS